MSASPFFISLKTITYYFFLANFVFMYLTLFRNEDVYTRSGKAHELCNIIIICEIIKFLAIIKDI